MAYVNADALNVLTQDQADEACRIVDLIGFVSNDLSSATSAQARSDAAHKLNKLRTDLKALFSKINNDRYPVIG